jgi:putative restriction endonuclease
MAGRPWTREETLAALNLYCRIPFGRLYARNPDIISLAKVIGRTPSSVAMKCCNLASFDPAQRARGIAGLNKASHLDEVIWNEFHNNPETVGYESEIQFAKLTHRKPRVSDSIQWEDIQGLDKQVVTKVRVNQHLFRSMILAGYRNECAVCRLPIPSLLVASHIVPWSIDKTQRMNPQNGICLCALHDRAFDVGVLRIGPDYRVNLAMPSGAMAKSAPVGMFLVAFDKKPISLPDRWHPEPQLLARHAATVGGSPPLFGKGF